MSDDIVYFLMPDGTKVSNDPRFDPSEVLEEALASEPYSGDAGVHDDDMTAQTQSTRMANLQSGQPGVGDNAAPDDPMAYVDPLHSGLATQKDDRNEAKEAGADATNTSMDDPDPVDSNERVQQAREARAKAEEEAAKAQAALGDAGPGDPDQDYSEWKSAQLKAEVAKRNADRDEDDRIDISGMTKKSQVAAALSEDDERQSGY